LGETKAVASKAKAFQSEDCLIGENKHVTLNQYAINKNAKHTLGSAKQFAYFYNSFFMSLQVCIMTPDRIFWNQSAQEIILPTNTGQMGVLSQHAALITALDIGVMSVRQNNAWTFFALMNGFASVQKDQITVLVNAAESKEDISAETAGQEFEEAQQRVDKANDKKERMEASLAFKRARTRYLVANPT
jgi:F-type H+-transporting ATPase subunit epsilon